MVLDTLFDEAAAVVAADHRIRQVHVFDLGLQLGGSALLQRQAPGRRNHLTLKEYGGQFWHMLQEFWHTRTAS